MQFIRRYLFKILIFAIAFSGSFWLYSYSLYADTIQEYKIQSLGVLNNTSQEVEVDRSVINEIPSVFDYAVYEGGTNYPLQQYKVKGYTPPYSPSTNCNSSDQFCIDTNPTDTGLNDPTNSSGSYGDATDTSSPY